MTVVPCHRHRLSHTGCISRFFRKFLTDDIGLEPPNAAAIVELRAGVDAGSTRTAIGNLACVGRKPDVHIHVAGVVERDVLLGVAAADRESVDDNFRGTRGLQLSRRQLESSDMTNAKPLVGVPDCTPS